MVHGMQQMAQWRQWYTSSQLVPMTIVIGAIGAIGNNHWSPSTPFQWRQRRHEMTMSPPGLPLKGMGAIGDNG